MAMSALFASISTNPIEEFGTPL